MESVPPNAWTESGRTPVLPESSNSREVDCSASSHGLATVRRDYRARRAGGGG